MEPSDIILGKKYLVADADHVYSGCIGVALSVSFIQDGGFALVGLRFPIRALGRTTDVEGIYLHRLVPAEVHPVEAMFE